VAAQKVPNPRFDVRANTDRVEGWNWTYGDEVILTIDDPDTVDDPDYTTSLTVDWALWDTDHTQTLVVVDLGGVYDIQPCDEVNLSNVAVTKTTTVTDLAITDIDFDADIVHGVAAPYSQLDIWVSTPPD
jgi:hypothetical protein